MRSWKRRERTQSCGEGRCAPCLHRPRAGGRLRDRQASSQMQGWVGESSLAYPAPSGVTGWDQHLQREKQKGMGSDHQGELLSQQSRGLFKVQETADTPAGRRQGHQRVTSIGGEGTSEESPGRQHAQQHAGPQNPNSFKAKVWRLSTTNISKQRLSKAYTASQVKSYPTRADHSAASQ